MIGGIADWFAVTALFRRPLSLPIPHTAIVPRNKDRIASELASFIKTNFLSEEVLRKHLQSLDAAGRLGDWLASEELRKKLSDRLAAVASETIGLLDERAIRDFIEGNLYQYAEKVEISPAAGRILDAVLNGRHRDELFAIGSDALEKFLTNNREFVSRAIREEVPWWVPGFVHDRIFDDVLAGIRKSLRIISDNPQSPLRQRLMESLTKFISNLKNDIRYKEYGDELKREMLESSFGRKYVADLAWQLKEALRAAIEDRDSQTNSIAAELLKGFGEMLQKSVAVRERINTWTERVILDLIVSYRDEISGVIFKTMKQWDASTIVNKIESQVGKDLQYIRINGTIVGGLAGLLLHFLFNLA